MLHEDALADTADGFGGGQTREQRLHIMRDSRTGAYGVCALALSILLRVSALASLADTALVVPALIAAHAGARAVMPAFMLFVPPARPTACRSPPAGRQAGARLPPRSWEFSSPRSASVRHAPQSRRFCSSSFSG